MPHAAAMCVTSALPSAASHANETASGASPRPHLCSASASVTARVESDGKRRMCTAAANTVPSSVPSIGAAGAASGAPTRCGSMLSEKASPFAAYASNSRGRFSRPFEMRYTGVDGES
jgi:hypothetical protein